MSDNTTNFAALGGGVVVGAIVVGGLTFALTRGDAPPPEPPPEPVVEPEPQPEPEPEPEPVDPHELRELVKQREGHVVGPVFSADGQWLAYEVFGKGNWRTTFVTDMAEQTHAIGPAGHEPGTMDVAGPAWHPDGRLFFESAPAGKRGAGLVYGSDAQGLSDGAFVGEPVVVDGSAGQTEVAVASDGTLAWIFAGELFVLPPDGEPRQLTSTEGREREPVFSPDGTRIMVSRGGLGSRDLVAIDVASGDETVLADGPGDQIRGVWLDDGVAYTSSARIGQPFDVLLARNGETTVLQTDVRIGVRGALSLSPDRSTLLWVSTVQPADVVMYDLASGTARTFATGLKAAEGPVLGPDGQLVLSGNAVDQEDTYKRLYVVVPHPEALIPRE